jgi:Zn-dependent peptidase ImmA (M78 family)
MYMCADDDCSVAIQRTLPEEPKLFALVHELKHHYRDRATIINGRIVCGDYNANELIEKGAEVFAAEFIYPEAEFAADIARLGMTVWQAETVVRLKRGCKAKVSYRFLCKRLERLGLIVRGQFDRVQFQKLEDACSAFRSIGAERHPEILSRRDSSPFFWPISRMITSSHEGCWGQVIFCSFVEVSAHSNSRCLPRLAVRHGGAKLIKLRSPRHGDSRIPVSVTVTAVQGARQAMR